jgi:hypothetical protein
MLWGGRGGRGWAGKLVEQMNSADNKSYSDQINKMNRMYYLKSQKRKLNSDWFDEQDRALYDAGQFTELKARLLSHSTVHDERIEHTDIHEIVKLFDALPSTPHNHRLAYNTVTNGLAHSQCLHVLAYAIGDSTITPLDTYVECLRHHPSGQSFAWDGSEGLEVSIADASLKSIQSTRLDFEGEVDALYRKALRKEIGFEEFESALEGFVRRYSFRAFLDGLEAGGVTSGMDATDSGEYNILLNQQLVFVTSATITLFDDGVTELEATNKGNMWFNKTIYPFYIGGLSRADKSGMYEWVRGATSDSCKTCVDLNGVTHRLRWFAKRGLFPKSDRLVCRGFNCKCLLVRRRK